MPGKFPVLIQVNILKNASLLPITSYYHVLENSEISFQVKINGICMCTYV